jgi:hypothetical protein
MVWNHSCWINAAPTKVAEEISGNGRDLRFFFQNSVRKHRFETFVKQSFVLDVGKAWAQALGQTSENIGSMVTGTRINLWIG